jgi:hypothetical protein
MEDEKRNPGSGPWSFDDCEYQLRTLKMSFCLQQYRFLNCKAQRWASLTGILTNNCKNVTSKMKQLIFC